MAGLGISPLCQESNTSKHTFGHIIPSLGGSSGADSSSATLFDGHSGWDRPNRYDDLSDRDADGEHPGVTTG